MATPKRFQDWGNAGSMPTYSQEPGKTKTPIFLEDLQDENSEAFRAVAKLLAKVLDLPVNRAGMPLKENK